MRSNSLLFAAFAAIFENIKQYDREGKILIQNAIETLFVSFDTNNTGKLSYKNLNVGFAMAVVDDMEVAETYSPPCITDMAEKMGMKKGWALDPTTHDVTDLLLLVGPYDCQWQRTHTP